MLIVIPTTKEESLSVSCHSRPRAGIQSTSVWIPNQVGNDNTKPMNRFSKIIFISAMLTVTFFNVGQVFAQTKSKIGIPDCALDNPVQGNPGAEKECRSISIFVTVLINAANYLFTIVGALALLFFIYGGFTLILSRGSTDQVKKGKDIMVAAIVGLIIVFGAYMLVRFLGEAVGLKGDYTLLGS